MELLLKQIVLNRRTQQIAIVLLVNGERPEKCLSQKRTIATKDSKQLLRLEVDSYMLTMTRNRNGNHNDDITCFLAPIFPVKTEKCALCYFRENVMDAPCINNSSFFVLVLVVGCCLLFVSKHNCIS